MHLDPLTIEESRPGSLGEALLFGSQPAIRTVDERSDREADLASYVETYLEEEVRQEALVRNVGAFGRFLELVGQESGGIAHHEIHCDCLVAERVAPVTRSASRKKLIKASRLLLFHLGVRRLAAREGTRFHPRRMKDGAAENDMETTGRLAATDSEQARETPASGIP
jgi:hypothetical protein